MNQQTFFDCVRVAISKGEKNLSYSGDITDMNDQTVCYKLSSFKSLTVSGDVVNCFNGCSLSNIDILVKGGKIVNSFCNSRLSDCSVVLSRLSEIKSSFCRTQAVSKKIDISSSLTTDSFNVSEVTAELMSFDADQVHQCSNLTNLIGSAFTIRLNGKQETQPTESFNFGSIWCISCKIFLSEGCSEMFSRSNIISDLSFEVSAANCKQCFDGVTVKSPSVIISGAGTLGFNQFDIVSVDFDLSGVKSSFINGKLVCEDRVTVKNCEASVLLSTVSCKSSNFIVENKDCFNNLRLTSSESLKISGLLYSCFNGSKLTVQNEINVSDYAPENSFISCDIETKLLTGLQFIKSFNSCNMNIGSMKFTKAYACFHSTNLKCQKFTSTYLEDCFSKCCAEIRDFGVVQSMTSCGKMSNFHFGSVSIGEISSSFKSASVHVEKSFNVRSVTDSVDGGIFVSETFNSDQMIKSCSNCLINCAVMKSSFFEHNFNSSSVMVKELIGKTFQSGNSVGHISVKSLKIDRLLLQNQTATFRDVISVYGCNGLTRQNLKQKNVPYLEALNQTEIAEIPWNIANIKCQVSDSNFLTVKNVTVYCSKGFITPSLQKANSIQVVKSPEDLLAKFSDTSNSQLAHKTYIKTGKSFTVRPTLTYIKKYLTQQTGEEAASKTPKYRTDDFFTKPVAETKSNQTQDPVTPPEVTLPDNPIGSKRSFSEMGIISPGGKSTTSSKIETVELLFD